GCEQRATRAMTGGFGMHCLWKRSEWAGEAKSCIYCRLACYWRRANDCKPQRRLWLSGGWRPCLDLRSSGGRTRCDSDPIRRTGDRPGRKARQRLQGRRCKESRHGEKRGRLALASARWQQGAIVCSRLAVMTAGLYVKRDAN
ncbi:hypothetical protein CLAIMM_09592, partial [Cladophialophora immunda]